MPKRDQRVLEWSPPYPGTEYGGYLTYTAHLFGGYHGAWCLTICGVNATWGWSGQRAKEYELFGAKGGTVTSESAAGGHRVPGDNLDHATRRFGMKCSTPQASRPFRCASDGDFFGND